MLALVRSVYGLIKETVLAFLADNCFRLAAALAYYTLFSLPGLLMIVITVTTFLLGPQAAQGRLSSQISDLVGAQAAEQIQTLVTNLQERKSDSTAATILGLIAFAFGATGAFGQLQMALNKAWNVEPKVGVVRRFFRKRLLSFAMVLVIAFLLLVSLVVSTILPPLVQYAGAWLPGYASTLLLKSTNGLWFFVVVLLLFAAIFKVLPDAQIAWRSVWLGAGVTTLLFMGGKALIGLYLGRSSVISAYGATGSLAVLLLWLYYSSVILFAGAEFTQVWSRRHGHRILPSPGAVRHQTPKKKQAQAEDHPAGETDA